MATQAAEKRLHERCEELRRRLSTARRETSTQEVIEVATGARWAHSHAARAGLVRYAGRSCAWKSLKTS